MNVVSCNISGPYMKMGDINKIRCNIHLQQSLQNSEQMSLRKMPRKKKDSELRAHLH